MISKILFRSPLSKLAPRVVAPTKNVLAVAVRSFASGKEITPEKGKQKLAKAISREVKYEQENYQADDSINNFLQENGFKLRDTDGDNNLQLSKTVGDTNIVIAFQSRAPQVNEDEQEEGEEQGQIQKKQEEENQEGEEGQQQGMQDFCDFTVYLVKPGGKGMVYECTSFDGEINVNYVNITDDVEGHKKLSRFERSASHYNGPDFSTLDERLQTALIEYLKGYGVTEELAVFVEHVSLDKEQRLYVKWLKDVNKFIEGNQ